MNFLKPILEILNKPFPEQESRFGAPKTIAIISVFVAFFLYIFQPFGIVDLESGKFWICLGFGFMTFLGAGIFEFIVGSVLKLKGELENWTFGKWILNNIGVMLTISLANFLFVRMAVFGFIEWELFPHMVYGTFMVGIIPVIVLGGFSLLAREKKYKNIAQDINLNKVADADNQIDESYFLFDIPVNRIKYIQGLQNYVSIGFVDEEGQFKKKVERATLKNISEETSGTPIIKSHRSFLVNRNAIISTSGNAQGLLLHLTESDRTIPVSRTYVPVLRSFLGTNSLKPSL